MSLKKTEKAYEILKNYQGDNRLINNYKYFVFERKDKTLNSFEVEFIIKNHDFKKEKINKVIHLAKWYAEDRKERWGVDFIPEKVFVYDILGETDTTFYVVLRYRQSGKPIATFLSKKAILGDLRATDYNKLEVDFSFIEDKLAEYEYKLYDHQKTATKFLMSRKHCILADDQGLGKTLSAISATILDKYKKVLIICPASVKTTWKKELGRFIPEEDIGIVEGGNWVDNKYTIINFDIVDRHHKIPVNITKTITHDKNGKEVVKIKETKSRKKEVIAKAMEESNIYQANFDLIIIDEVHKLSNNTSNRYRVIEDFLNRLKPEGIYLLSGTPMTNKPINLYHVLKLINHPVTDNYGYYAKRYCDGRQITNRYTKQKIWLTEGASNLDELMLRVKDVYIRRMKEEVPGMVEKIISERYYDLTKTQRNEYESVWEDYVEEQNMLGKKTNFNRDLTEGIFLRQFIANVMIDNTIELTNEFLEEGNKVLIACSFDNEITKLKEYYGDKAVIYKGGMTRKQKDTAEDRFMNDDSIKVFIGNIEAAGVGLTLISSNICIFNSYDWVPGNNSQMMDRVHRIGQQKDVQIYFQLFNNTISERMWNTVIRKSLNIGKVIKEEEKKVP